MVNQNSLFGDVFETDPLGRRALFQAARPDDLRTGFQQDVFSNMFDRTLNNYLRTLGQSVTGGSGIPATTFTEFLDNQDFGRQLRAGNVFDTGRQQSPFRSAATFLFDR